ncbi:MAG TPA: ABC transporter ATP-binding protein [Natronosporangium sp.]
MRIEISGLTKTFRGGVAALADLDLVIPTGMFGLLGANGAGKTTLMRILAGIMRPTRGRVTVGGHDLGTAAGRTAVQQTLGYLPQDLGVYPDLTARQFLDYVALLKGIDDRAARRRRVAELLEVVALTSDADRRLRGFSGGMRQRVGIAQALLADPQLLIVDEPTAGLDPEERIRFRTLLSRLVSTERTVLLSTHIVDDIAQTCRELAVLAKGRLIFRGTVDQLTRQAEGRVWSVTTAGPPPPGTVVSALPHSGGMRYRLVAPARPSPAASPVEPSLEDGYLALTGTVQQAPVRTG